MCIESSFSICLCLNVNVVSILWSKAHEIPVAKNKKCIKKWLVYIVKSTTTHQELLTLFTKKPLWPSLHSLDYNNYTALLHLMMDLFLLFSLACYLQIFFLFVFQKDDNHKKTQRFLFFFFFFDFGGWSTTLIAASKTAFTFCRITKSNTFQSYKPQTNKHASEI